MRENVAQKYFLWIHYTTRMDDVTPRVKTSKRGRKPRGKRRRATRTKPPIHTTARRGGVVTQVFLNTQGRTRYRGSRHGATGHTRRTMSDLKGDVGVARNLTMETMRPRREYPARFGGEQYLSQYKLAQIENKLNNFETKDQLKSRAGAYAERMKRMEEGQVSIRKDLKALDEGRTRTMVDIKDEVDQLSRNVERNAERRARENNVPPPAHSAPGSEFVLGGDDQSSTSTMSNQGTASSQPTGAYAEYMKLAEGGGELPSQRKATSLEDLRQLSLARDAAQVRTDVDDAALPESSGDKPVITRTQVDDARKVGEWV